MTIPPWRLALAAGTLVVLGAIGAGLVQAAATSTGPSADTTTPVPIPEDAAAHIVALRDRLDERHPGLRQHLVHGTLTVLGRNGKLVTLQLDHGTVASVGSASITIAEAGGTSITVATTAETRVRKDRKPATLADLKVGDEVVVQSTVDGGSATARRVVVPAARPAAAAPSNGGDG
jgi:preprotein translocase subunit YajC